MAFHVKFLLIIAVGFISCDPFPFEKCKLEDLKCMKEAVQKYAPTFIDGIPEYGTEVLDVMEMDEIDFDLAGLKFNLKEGKLKGLKNSVIDRVKWDSNKKRLDIDFHVNTTIRGHYKAGGRLLILPITGDGNMKMKLRNLAVKLRLDFDMVKDEAGKVRAIPKKYGFDYEVRDNAHFDLTNLFNGNKELSDAMLLFLNENWKQISVEFGAPIMEASAKKIYKSVAKFMSQFPLEDIAIV